jgi:hypothetical protein
LHLQVQSGDPPAQTAAEHRPDAAHVELAAVELERVRVLSTATAVNVLVIEATLKTVSSPTGVRDAMSARP